MAMMTVHDMSVPDLTEREDRWESAMTQHYATVKVRASTGPISEKSNILERQDIDDLRLIRIAATECTARTSRQDFDDSYIALILVRSGGENVAYGDDRFRLSTGDAAIWDPRRATTFDVDRSISKSNLVIPRALLRTIGVGNDALSTGIRRTPTLQILDGLLSNAWSALPRMEQAEKVGTRNAILELVSAAFRPDDSANRALGLRRQIDEWVKRNLHTDVTLASAAAANSISIRSLSRLYQSDDESFTQYVRRLRLMRARQDVLGTDALISDIAHRWKFSDASHFTRRFTDEFGVTPTAARLAAHRANDEPLAGESHAGEWHAE